MWRYREALPIESDRSIVTMSEGYTPLIEEKICGKNVFIKMDHLLPTGSYKDRGASLLVSYAREHQVSSLVEDSSGNAGCSIAAYSARAGISCEIFVPDHTSVGKLRQIEAYGSKVRLVEGSREDVSRKILEQTKESFYASHVYNPVFLHGTKTLAFEICEQLGWNSPGAIVVPVGNGTLLLGASIGFGELYSAGIVDNLPKIIAVQAENCAPLLRAFEMNQKDSADVNAEATVSEGIAIEKPVRGAQILKAVRDSRGTFVGVSEQEIRGNNSGFKEVHFENRS